MEPGEQGKKTKKKEKPRETLSEVKKDTETKDVISKEPEKKSTKVEKSMKKDAKSYEELEKFVGQEWTGQCKWFNVTRGFGFIVADNQEDSDVFVHQVYHYSGPYAH
uniref:CSD domain-containing protein n=1 Tax=Acrobeloides nanus TaxID=290746 RepID=A0A914C7V9_9BILA